MALPPDLPPAILTVGLPDTVPPADVVPLFAVPAPPPPAVNAPNVVLPPAVPLPALVPFPAPPPPPPIARTQIALTFAGVVYVPELEVNT